MIELKFLSVFSWSHLQTCIRLKWVSESLSMIYIDDPCCKQHVSMSINAMGAVVDVLIATSLCALLQRSRTGFKKCVSRYIFSRPHSTESIQVRFHDQQTSKTFLDRDHRDYNGYADVVHREYGIADQHFCCTVLGYRKLWYLFNLFIGLIIYKVYRIPEHPHLCNIFLLLRPPYVHLLCSNSPIVPDIFERSLLQLSTYESQLS